MTQKDLVHEIETLIDASTEEAIVSAWLINKVVARHRPKNLAADGAGWVDLCAYGHVSVTVRNVLRRYDPGVENPEAQILMPGFERLQIRYPVTRDGEQRLVLTANLTEIDAKCVELDRTATGCRQHISELRRYQAARKAAA